jgi:uncharacterized protein (DUF1330 family)
MGNAYVIGHITVKDAGKWDAYRGAVPATLAPWGAELVFRGRNAAVLAGDHEHADVVVMIPLRRQAADVVLLAYDE